MWPTHQTCNSVKDCSPFWTISPMQENGDILFYSQLDALYFHIMKQIPGTILLSAQSLLFVYAMRYWEGDTCMHVSVLCCVFRIFEYTFKDICYHLHAVIPMRHICILSAQLTPVSTSHGRFMTKVNCSIRTC